MSDNWFKVIFFFALRPSSQTLHANPYSSTQTPAIYSCGQTIFAPKGSYLLPFCSKATSLCSHHHISRSQSPCCSWIIWCILFSTTTSLTAPDSLASQMSPSLVTATLPYGSDAERKSIQTFWESHLRWSDSLIADSSSSLESRVVRSKFLWLYYGCYATPDSILQGYIFSHGFEHCSHM